MYNHHTNVTVEVLLHEAGLLLAGVSDGLLVSERDKSGLNYPLPGRVLRVKFGYYPICHENTYNHSFIGR